MEPDWAPLSLPERQALLQLARDSIIARLQNAPTPQLATPSASLSAASGVFVSLHVGGDLRGCVGTLTADRALHENVSRLAVAAAFGDPRFPPLTEAEVPATTIEISRLTAPRPATAEEIVVGRDGVCVTLGECHGLLLPQVATEHGWDRYRLLSEVCRKAHLAPSAWQRTDCELVRFEAEIFSDRSLAR